MARRLRSIHPGEILVEEFLEPFRVTPYRLAKDIDVPVTRISEICRGRCAVTVDTALRLAQYFGTAPKFWLGLQEDYDIEEHRRAKSNELRAIEPRTKTGS